MVFHVLIHVLDLTLSDLCSTVKLGYKVTIYNINLFTTTHTVLTDSMVSVLNVLVTTTTTWL